MALRTNAQGAHHDYRDPIIAGWIEEGHFKRVAEGWLFTVSNPWIVAPRRTYLVNDAQKPAIAARVRLARCLRLMVVLPMIR